MKTEYRFQGKRQEILVEIVYSARKSMGLQVKEDGCVIARMPRYISDKECVKFIEEHREWIERKLELVLERYTMKNQSRFPVWSDIGTKERQQIKKKIEEVVSYCSECMGGISYGRITVRNQKTR